MSTETSHSLPDHRVGVLPADDSHFATRTEWQAGMAEQNNIPGDEAQALPKVEVHTISDLVDRGDTKTAAAALLNSVMCGEAPELENALQMRALHILHMAGRVKGLGALTTIGAGLIMHGRKVQEYLVNERNMVPEYEALIASWPEVRRTVIEGVEQGIALGYIPDYVADRVPSALSQTLIHLTDNAVLEAQGIFPAYYDSEHDAITLSDSGGDKVIHEIAHKLSGGTFIEEERDGDIEGLRVTRIRAGNSNLVAHDLTRRRTTEAVNEHVAQGMATGDFETIDPHVRSHNELLYGTERTILAAFVANSEGIVTAKAVVRSHFEDTGPEGSFSERRNLVQASREAYGPGAWRKLEELCALADQIASEQGGLINRDEMATRILSRIHAPKLDVEGKVMEVGWIDVAGYSS